MIDKAKRIVSTHHFDCVITSPIRRAHETAEIITPSPIIDSSWRERDYGDWEGLPFANFESCLAAGETPPNGETRNDFITRCVRAISTINKTDSVLVVSHGGVWQALHDYAGAAAPWLNPADFYMLTFNPDLKTLSSQQIL